MPYIRPPLHDIDKWGGRFSPEMNKQTKTEKKTKKVRTVMQFGRRGAVVCRRPLLSSRANELPL